MYSWTKSIKIPSSVDKAANTTRHWIHQHLDLPRITASCIQLCIQHHSAQRRDKLTQMSVPDLNCRNTSCFLTNRKWNVGLSKQVSTNHLLHQGWSTIAKACKILLVNKKWFYLNVSIEEQGFHIPPVFCFVP